MITNAMTVDVEEYFQVSAFENTVHREDWPDLASRVEASVDTLLKVFDEQNIKATFFTLGWIAERHPNMIRTIVRLGHELASHGYDHARVTTLTPVAFKQDVVKTRQILEDLSGNPVIGYRAPSYSIDQRTPWAHELLAEAGYRYSTSVYPVKHDLYGMPEAPRFRYRPLPGSDFWEIPVTTLNVRGKNFPCGGGGFFRLYPYALSRWALNRINQQERQAAMFYCHPWEIDPDQPRPDGLPLKARFRHYLNLSRMQPRIVKLSRDFHWATMRDVFLTDTETVSS